MPAANGRVTSKPFVIPSNHSRSGIEGERFNIHHSCPDELSKVAKRRGTPPLRPSVGFRTLCSSRIRPSEKENLADRIYIAHRIPPMGFEPTT